MAAIPREYFTLDEALEDWGITESELRYVIENGQLTLSVRIYGSFAERDGRTGAVRYNPDFEGVVDLRRRDAMKVLRKGNCPVGIFHATGGDDVYTSEGGTDWIVFRDALLVRAVEWDSFEESVITARSPHINDYVRFLSFSFDGGQYHFTDMQARALNFLFICAVTGDPEQRGVDVLNAAGSSSVKLSYLFSSRANWRDVIQTVPGRRGYYRLHPGVVVAMRMEL